MLQLQVLELVQVDGVGVHVGGGHEGVDSVGVRVDGMGVHVDGVVQVQLRVLEHELEHVRMLRFVVLVVVIVV